MELFTVFCSRHVPYFFPLVCATLSLLRLSSVCYLRSLTSPHLFTITRLSLPVLPPFLPSYVFFSTLFRLHLLLTGSSLQLLHPSSHSSDIFFVPFPPFAAFLHIPSLLYCPASCQPVLKLHSSPLGLPDFPFLAFFHPCNFNPKTVTLPVLP